MLGASNATKSRRLPRKYIYLSDSAPFNHEYHLYMSAIQDKNISKHRLFTLFRGDNYIRFGNPDSKNGDKFLSEYPLTVAVRKKNIHVVRLLLEIGANVNCPPDETSLAHPSPLLQAVLDGNVEMVDLLSSQPSIQLDTPFEAPNKVKTTPLLTAIELKNETIARLLISRGAGVNVQSTTQSNDLSPLEASPLQEPPVSEQPLAQLKPNITDTPTTASLKTGLFANAVSVKFVEEKKSASYSVKMTCYVVENDAPESYVIHIAIKNHKPVRIETTYACKSDSFAEIVKLEHLTTNDKTEVLELWVQFFCRAAEEVEYAQPSVHCD